jgi:hypothetical protein
MNFPFAYWKDIDFVPGVEYKYFTCTLETNNDICTNGAPEVYWQYDSVSAGNNVSLFTDVISGDICDTSPADTLTLTTCLPSDATNFVYVPNSDYGQDNNLSGTNRTSPVITATICS